mgnify:CR=1 FL=1
MSDCKALQPIAVTVPGVNLGSYIQAVNSVSVLTAEEERALAERERAGVGRLRQGSGGLRRRFAEARPRER